MNIEYIKKIAREAQAEEKSKDWWLMHTEDLDRLVAIVIAELGMSQYMRGYEAGKKSGVEEERKTCIQRCEAVPIKGKRVDIKEACLKAIKER